MKVLLTGMTRRQVEPARAVELYFAIFNGYAAAIRAAGHELDWRPVTPGEELRGRYDVAVVGIHSYGSMSSAHKHGAMWAAHELPHVVAFEDWRLRTITSHARGRSENYVWNCAHLEEADMARYRVAAARSAEIQKVVEQWRFRIGSALVPTMPWGDPDGIRDYHRFGVVAGWDVDPFYPTPQLPEPLPPRERRWMMVSLSPQGEWLEAARSVLRWPVVAICPPDGQKDVGGARKKGMRPSEWGFTPEAELFGKWYATSRGVFLPHYGTHCPPGWWRNRWWLSAHAGCVLDVHPDEAAPGCSFRVPADQVEEMSDAQLDDLAAAQRADVMRRTLSKAESAAAMDKILRAPAGPVREER